MGIVTLWERSCSYYASIAFRDLQENKIPIFEREGWQSQPSLSKIGILLIRKSLMGSGMAVIIFGIFGCVGSAHTPKNYYPLRTTALCNKP